MHGFIREQHKALSLSYDVPEAIRDIIVFHYPLKFIFQRDIKGMNVSEDGFTLTSTSDGMYSTVRFGQFLDLTDRTFHH